MSNQKPHLKAALALAVSATSTLALHATADSLALEEIIVTAQKRAESLQDVPVSVAAVSGDKLKEAGIENIQDLSAYVPNLKVVDGGLVPQMYIRGIGSGSNQGFEQSVGVYTDGVYTGRSLQARSSFMDLERVEVLRGPQGILFGQSSIAGAISQISAKPTDEFEGLISGSYGAEYDETEASMVLSGPITESIRARLALRNREEGGYVTNHTLGSDGPEVDDKVVRLTLESDINDDLTGTLKIEQSRLERIGRPFIVTDTGAYNDTLAAAVFFGGTPLLHQGGVITQPATSSLDHDTWANEDEVLSFDNDSYVLTFNYDMDEHSLEFITAYSEYDYDDAYDAEHTEVPLVLVEMQEDFDQFSQEIRLTSSGDNTVDYIAGVFYQKSNQEYKEQTTTQLSALGLDFLASLASLADGGPAIPTGALDVFSDRSFTQESETWAAFGQLTWNITDYSRLLVGLRYSSDEKEAQRTQVQTSAITGLPLDPGVAAFIAEVPTSGGFQSADHDLEGKYKDENWTPSLIWQYDVSEDAMIYASYSEGYKAAGFDARGINGFSAGDTGAISGVPYGSLAQGAENFFFEQEEAKTYELGAKMTLLDGSAELNVALYWTEFSDMQVSVYDGTFGFAVTNAGEAVVRGLELDGRWQATESIMLSGSVGYLDYEWTEYSDGPCASVGGAPENVPGNPSLNCDFKGYENVNTPEWSANLAAIHTYSISEALELVSTIDLNFKDNHFTTGSLDTRSEMPGTTQVNARIGLNSTDDSWSAAIVAKNLTDQKLFAYTGDVTLSEGGLTGEILPPRRISIEAQYRF